MSDTCRNNKWIKNFCLRGTTRTMPYFYLTLVICALDQAIKLWVQAAMTPFQSINLLQGWVSITYVSNYGAAFGILHSKTLILLGVAVGAFVYVWRFRHEMQKYPKPFQIGIAIALGGALGNFVDRLRQGFVIDYLDVHFWPVFNLADIAILGGVGLVALSLMIQEMKHKKQLPSKSNSVAGEDNP